MPEPVILNQRSGYSGLKKSASLLQAETSVQDHHYTVSDVAAMLSLSADKVRRLFQNESGVVVIGDQTSRHKRRYTTLRIPEPVLRRVLRRMSNV